MDQHPGNPDPDPRPPISFSGRWVNLRAPTRADFPQIYAWRNDPHSLFLWHYNRRLLPQDEFVTEFEQVLRSTTTLLIEERESRSLIGFIQSYNANQFEVWTFVLLYLAPAHRLSRKGAEAWFIFLDYLFTSYPLRKIYTEVFEFNDLSLRSLQNAGFAEEGRLRKHVWYDDRYWDLVYLAIDRDAWHNIRTRLLPLYELQQSAHRVTTIPGSNHGRRHPGPPGQPVEDREEPSRRLPDNV